MEDSDSFSLYMNDIKNIKVLSYEEEKYLREYNKEVRNLAFGSLKSFKQRLSHFWDCSLVIIFSLQDSNSFT